MTKCRMCSMGRYMPWPLDGEPGLGCGCGFGCQWGCECGCQWGCECGCQWGCECGCQWGCECGCQWGCECGGPSASSQEIRRTGSEVCGAEEAAHCREREAGPVAQEEEESGVALQSRALVFGRRAQRKGRIATPDTPIHFFDQPPPPPPPPKRRVVYSPRQPLAVPRRPCPYSPAAQRGSLGSAVEPSFLSLPMGRHWPVGLLFSRVRPPHCPRVGHVGGVGGARPNGRWGSHRDGDGRVCV